MTVLLVVLGSVAAYLVVGAFYARSRAVAVHRKASRVWSSEAVVRESVTAMLVWRVLAWPYAVVFDAVAGGVAAWVRAPVDGRKLEAAQLRADADAWAGRMWARDASASERDMAEELARILRERAAEVDV